MFWNVEVEVIRKNGKLWVYLANDGSSGCKYQFQTKEELKQLINDYVADVVEYDFDPDSILEDDE